jgi:hypothetical protein
MRLEGESYGIHVGTFVTNCHHGLLRMGVVQDKRTGDHGWSYCKVDWFEDDLYIAKTAWDKKTGSTRPVQKEIRVDYLMRVSPEWLTRVLKSYGDYENERRTEFS